MKKAKIRFGTLLFILIFIIVIIFISLLTKNDGDIAKTTADVMSFFGR